MKTEFFSVLDHVYQILRVDHVSYEDISALMGSIFPRGKYIILRAFNDPMGKADFPVLENFNIVHYGEQCPEHWRTQKYRLTLLDSVSGLPIADELYSKKDPETIKNFLANHLDINKRTFVITDFYLSYFGALEDFFGENIVHKFCLLHLNNRIANGFPKKPTFKQELTKYRLLNIFYNREAEIEILKDKAKKKNE